MGFQHGLSGLKAASAKLDVIGNNIANANTVGFKQSQAQFSDIYASSLGGGGQVGIGTRVSAVTQDLSQGSITGTNNPLDIAIGGNGFFRMNNNGVVSYTRNGQFHLDKDGFLVNANNLHVTGFAADQSGQIIPNIPVDLQLPMTDLAPQPTTSFSIGLNLDAGTGSISDDFDAGNPDTYAYSTSGEIFDSLGNSHILTLYFQKTDSGKWSVFGVVDGATDDSGKPLGVEFSDDPLSIEFDENGSLIDPPSSVPMTVDFSELGIEKWEDIPALTFDFNLTSSTQFGSNFGINKLSQDGYSSGRLAGYSISDDGLIRGNYTNGATRTLGQIVLAEFSNPDGLKSVGDNQWVETSASGLPMVGTPLSGMLGSLQSSAIEESNVDLTTELVTMIMTQRLYQANAKTIQTQDTIMQTIVNI